MPGGIFDRVQLDIPYRSQEDADAHRYANDCGPACIGMWAEARGIRYTTNQLSEMTSLVKVDDGLTCNELVRLCTRIGLPAATVILSQDYIESELEAGRPIVPLIQYSAIPGRMAAFGGGHYFLVTGYDSEAVYVNDPDWWTPRRNEGNGFRVKWADLLRAMGTYGNQGVVFN